MSSTRSTEASFDERRACSEGLRSTFAGRAVCGRGGRAAMGGPLAAAPTGTSAAPEEEPADEPLEPLRAREGQLADDALEVGRRRLDVGEGHGRVGHARHPVTRRSSQPLIPGPLAGSSACWVRRAREAAPRPASAAVPLARRTPPE